MKITTHIIKSITKNNASGSDTIYETDCKILKYQVIRGSNEGYYLDIMDAFGNKFMAIRYHCSIELIAEDIIKIEQSMQEIRNNDYIRNNRPL